MSTVYFYKCSIDNIGGEPDEEIKGTIEQLAVFVHEQALVQWDRFLELNIVELNHDLRFVCIAGIWRAFSDSYGGFIAQWWMDPNPDSAGGYWSKKRTGAREKVEIDVPGFGKVPANIPTSGDKRDLKRWYKEQDRLGAFAEDYEPKLEFEDDPEGGITLIGADPGFNKGTLTVVAVDKDAGTITVGEHPGDVVVRPERCGICFFCGSEDGMLCVCYTR